jgi:uncharacterized membrane-anchored protein
MNELDELMDKIQLLFLNNTSIEEEHNKQHIKHQDFLDELKKLLKERFYSKSNINIKRYNVTPIIKEGQMTGISHLIDSDGVWVNYYDIRNLIEDNNRVISNLKNCISMLTGEHRINENGA